MSKFGDAFKRQVGRDTGKFVSNLIFGDKHSTPVRVTMRQEKNKLERKHWENELDLEKQRLRNKLELEKQELELKREHLKQERLNQICFEISRKIENLAEFEFPVGKDEIIKTLKKWDIQLRSYSFWCSDEGKIYLNQYMNALKCKYQQGIQKLIQHGATISEIAPYRQTIRFYYFKKTWSVIGIPVCLGIFVFIVILLTT